MKLKRYVLLDDNRIYDRNKIKTREDNFPMFDILKQIENDDTDNLCRQLVATSDDATNLIRVGDLVSIEYKTTRELVVKEIEHRDHLNEILNNEFGLKERVYAIYKLIDKNYICVWEKEI